MLPRATMSPDQIGPMTPRTFDFFQAVFVRVVKSQPLLTIIDQHPHQHITDDLCL